MRERALAFALTGEDLPVVVGALPRQLAALGWDADRIADQARSRLDGGEVWPWPPPREWVAEVGWAEFAASLQALREELGCWTLHVAAPSSRTKLNADELRLIQEVPPHHGS
ncbi:MAG: hypothetical protein LBR58_02765 [Propionibacteriaceae bacterium]|jgi:hypothetical protein|nr:hypothetical protein [Propionibacteriaceae bacterium]